MYGTRYEKEGTVNENKETVITTVGVDWPTNDPGHVCGPQRKRGEATPA